MALAKVLSCAVAGLDGEIIECEVDVSRRGLNSLAMVGLPDTAVKEAKDRVESAIKNSGIRFPQGRIIVNLAPADLRKEGPTYDLPIAPAWGVYSIGVLESIDTGTPYGAAGTINSSPYVTNPGYVQVATAVTYYFTARDAFRTETTYQTDLSLNMSKTIGPVEIFIQPQVLNVFNAQHVVAVDTSVFTAASSGGGNNKFAPFNPFTTAPTQRPHGDTTVTTANWDYGPNFGHPTAFTSSSVNGSFQLPRTFRVSVGLRF